MSTKQIQKSIQLIQELVDANNPILYNLIDSGKSHDITEIVAKKYDKSFIKLVDDFSAKSSIEQCIKLFNYIGVEPLKFIELIQTNSKFRIELLDRPIEQLQCFLDYAKSKVDGHNIKYPFQFIEEITYNHAFHLLSVWSDEEKKDLNKFKLLWITEQNHLKNELLNLPALKDRDSCFVGNSLRLLRNNFL